MGKIISWLIPIGMLIAALIIPFIPRCCLNKLEKYNCCMQDRERCGFGGGKFRTGKVRIAGTRIYEAPKFEDLDNIFDSEINKILSGSNPVEKVCVIH